MSYPNTSQARIEAIGKMILEPVKQSAFSFLKKDTFYRKVLDWSMSSDHLKTQLFRFVDVLPSLQDGEDVLRHLKEYLADEEGNLPAIFSLGLGIGGIAPGIAAGLIKKNVTQMARLFITGSTVEEVIAALQEARKEKKTFTLDILGEATLSEAEALSYQKQYLELVEKLGLVTVDWPALPQIDEGPEGLLPKANISVKLSSLYSQINDRAWDDSKAVLKERLRPILTRAKQLGVFINLDMEQYALKDLTLEVFREIIFEKEYADYPHLGIVIQAYLKDSLGDLQGMIALAKNRKVPFTIRLVKGAYWDFETIHARSKNWTIPVYTHKAQTDANYEACTRLLLENAGIISAAIASHNVRSLAAAFAYAESLHLPKNAFEVQMLYGMADPFKKQIIDAGYRLREYATIGSLIPGMAYLVRRLLENSSNESFLRHSLAEHQSIEKLLKDPAEALGKDLNRSEKPIYYFENEPFLDFGIASNRNQAQAAIEAFPKGLYYPLVIEGKAVQTSQKFQSFNPSYSSEVIGDIALASQEDADRAIEVAQRAFEAWKSTPVKERAAYLRKLADLMQNQRFELIAAIVHEVGKIVPEADAEVAEAIDFCRYYAIEMEKLAIPQKAGHAPGENSCYYYQPRGVALIVAPWNFPLAILTGMTVAALVAGNTVIMKPAKDASVIGALLMQLMKKADFPDGVINFLPCEGKTVGSYLVSHPRIATIAFTGSRDVGLHIYQNAGVLPKGSRQLKRCIIEMGGKNAMIIDNDADLDEAVTAAAYSALGYSGQKCSALSRAIVLEQVYETFLHRLVERFKSLKVLPAEDPRAYLGPVINESSHKKLIEAIEQGKKDARLLYQAEDLPSGGFFIPPTIFADVPLKSQLAEEELFGPILAVMKARNINEAIAIANDSDYALTGGVFSRSPYVLAKVADEMEAGNVYLNRGITGALVERHPFGGFKLSGTGTKAGGPDYLLHFLDPKVVIENTMRRGFAPEED